MKIKRLLQHFFLPHTSNNHRSKILHLDAMLSYVLVLLVFNFGLRFVHREYPEVLGYATDIRVDQLLAETNTKRQNLGLAPLELNTQLSDAAAAKAKNMFEKNYWAHTSPDGDTPWQFILGANYRYTLAGENLAKNFSDSHSVVEAWMASPTHRDNIIKPGYREMGFAVVNGILGEEETTLVVQMFGATEGQALVSSGERLAVSPKQPQISEQSASEEAPVLAQQQIGQARGAAFLSENLTSVLKKPLLDMPTVTHNVVFVFVGILMGVLAVDALVVARRGTVRLSGHNVAHILFLSAILIALSSVPGGSLL